MKREWFGTDGVRGEYGRFPMEPGFVKAMGRAVVREFGEGKAYVIGRDTRASGPVLEDALREGIMEEGGEVRGVGVLPSAAVALVTRAWKAAAGMVISASHNPHTDNGVKVVGGEGFKLGDETELRIESHLRELLEQGGQEEPDQPVEKEPDFGCDGEAFALYRHVLAASLPEAFSLAGVRMVVDAGNGAAWRTTSEVLRSYSAEVELLHAAPDGHNINAACGSQHTEDLQRVVREAGGGALGLAHDGDADRVIFVDEEGQELDGDEVLAILGTHMLEAGRLTGETLVATRMSNLGLDEAIAKAGGKVVRTDVGDRYVLEAMRAGGFALGGEQSGHMIFPEHSPTGDGLLTALQLLRVVVETGRSLKELRRVMPRYPQKLVNLKVREKPPIQSLPQVQAAIREVEARLGSKGRVFLRYSGTENKIRLLLESRDGSVLDELAGQVLEPLRNSIGIQESPE